MQRRKFIKVSALTAVGISVLPTVGAEVLSVNGNDKLKKKAARIHEKILTVDSHCDTPLSILYQNVEMGVRSDSRKGGSKVDFVKMKEGGLDASFFAVFLGQGKRDEESNKKAKGKALEIFTAIKQQVNKYTSLAELAVSPSDAYRIQKAGKRAIFIGIENGYPVGTDVKNVEEFYKLGARYITLCHTSNNDICDSSTDKKGEEHGGLSNFGKKVVKEMNRLGMMVDVSHISDKSFYDVLKISNAPIIASHSSARKVCNHPRNLDDEMLKALAKNGGVVQLCVLNSYIKEQDPDPKREEALKQLHIKYKNFEDLSEEDRKKASNEWRQIFIDYPEELATVEEAVDHIDHMVKVAGVDHVGIGTDFDGGGGISGFFDISEAGNITYELVKRGYSAKDIEKIWGGNFMRVFNKVQELATS